MCTGSCSLPSLQRFRSSPVLLQVNIKLIFYIKQVFRNNIKLIFFFNTKEVCLQSIFGLFVFCFCFLLLFCRFLFSCEESERENYTFFLLFLFVCFLFCFVCLLSFKHCGRPKARNSKRARRRIYRSWEGGKDITIWRHPTPPPTHTHKLSRIKITQNERTRERRRKRDNQTSC